MILGTGVGLGVSGEQGLKGMEVGLRGFCVEGPFTPLALSSAGESSP